MTELTPIKDTSTMTLEEESKYIIETYGEDTIAAKYAVKVLNFLNKSEVDKPSTWINNK